MEAVRKGLLKGVKQTNLLNNVIRSLSVSAVNNKVNQ